MYVNGRRNVLRPPLLFPLFLHFPRLHLVHSHGIRPGTVSSPAVSVRPIWPQFSDSESCQFWLCPVHQTVLAVVIKTM
ncbi:hypothetical protein H4582DRAFT_2019859 [Lactarius indigo]|nr:hypothetical protein H4582DRAFT_2019859 [Lactarius indigo]